MCEMLASDKYDDEVRFDEREAGMRGVRGVPYIVFNGEFAVPGAMSIDNFRQALKREMDKTADKPSDSITGRAHTCGPDGCQLM